MSSSIKSGLVALFFCLTLNAQNSGFKLTLEDAYGKIPFDFVTGGSVSAWWTAGANLVPSPRYYGASASYTVGEETWVYVFGGDTTGGGVPSRTAVKYHINSNTWSYIAQLPKPLRLACAVTAGSKIYVFGGFDAPGNVPPLSDAYVYDILTDQWSTITEMPYGLFYGRAVSFEDSLIYIIGGSHPTLEAVTDLSLKYNINFDKYEEATPLPYAVGDGGIAIDKNFIFYFGGYISDINTTANILKGVINPNNRKEITWTIPGIVLGGGRARINAYNINGNFLVGGGSGTNGFDVKNDWYLYVPTLNDCRLTISPSFTRTAYMGGYYPVQSRDIEIAEVMITGGVVSGPALTGTTEIYRDSIEVTSVLVSDHTPVSFRLLDNYPNPFNPSTTIRFEVPYSSHVKIVVYNILGNEVAVLTDEKFSPGVYETGFNASELASGVYLYMLTADNFTQSKQMILLK